MFGDYDTGLTVTELSRYSRTLNGVKSEYKARPSATTPLRRSPPRPMSRIEIRATDFRRVQTVARQSDD